MLAASEAYLATGAEHWTPAGHYGVVVSQQTDRAREEHRDLCPTKGCTWYGTVCCRPGSHRCLGGLRRRHWHADPPARAQKHETGLQ